MLKTDLSFLLTSFFLKEKLYLLSTFFVDTNGQCNDVSNELTCFIYHCLYSVVNQLISVVVCALNESKYFISNEERNDQRVLTVLIIFVWTGIHVNFFLTSFCLLSIFNTIRQHIYHQSWRNNDWFKKYVKEMQTSLHVNDFINKKG